MILSGLEKHLTSLDIILKPWKGFGLYSFQYWHYKDSRIVGSAQAEIITANNPNLLLLGRNMNNEYLWQLTVYYYLEHK